MRTAVGVGALALAAVLLAPVGGASASVNVGDPARLAMTPVSAAINAPAPGSPTPTPSPSTSATPSATSASLPAWASESSSEIQMRTFSYGPHPRQRMDVWWHAATAGATGGASGGADAALRPAVFVIHGGWWSGGDKRYMTQVSRHYAELGLTVVNINYRLSHDARWPAQRTDAIDAIATVRRHADMFNMDPDRYVILGFSAGGHIATAVGTYKDGVPGLRGVVGVSPVISPLTAFSDGDQGADYTQRKLRKAAIALAGGCGPTRCPRLWTSMEVPLQASPGDAPMLTVHSRDEFVPPYQSELLRQALATVGVKMTVETLDGSQHSAPLYREPGVADRIQSWIVSTLSD